MEWLNNHGSLLIAAGSLIVSIFALIRSNITASKSAKMQRSIQLSDYHEKVMPGRQAMETIFRNWSLNIGNGKVIEECSDADKENFVSFYNKHYHHGSDHHKKRLSNSVHNYLSRLHVLWRDSQKNTFEIDEIMQKFGDGMCIDEQYILIYLRAHQAAHPGEVFWQGVSQILEEAKSLESKNIIAGKNIIHPK